MPTAAAPPQLPEDLQQCHQLIGELLSQIRQLQVRNDWLARKLFGRSSERLGVQELEFFGQECTVAEPTAPAQEAAPPLAPRNGRVHTGGGRKSLPAELPRQRVEYDVTESEKICPECGGEKKRIGEETSEQLEYVPASYFVIEHACLKYACPRCQGHVSQGTKPAQPIEKAIAGPGLLAHVITSKYCDHLPLHRQEGILARQGLDLTRSTLCEWVMASADALAPVVRAMKTQILRSAAVNTDDTPLPVQDESKTHQAHLWVYVGDAAHPYTLYDFTWTRARDGPEKFLGDYEGYLQADAWGGYDGLFGSGKIIEVGCWAHARRYFFEAKETDPALANQALLRIGELYAVEREAAEGKLDAPARQALRQAKAAPLVESLGQWLAVITPTLLPKSPIGKAVAYAQSNWRALTRYLEDGRLAIDNNAAENALRPVVVGRKNWLFTGSRRGGRAAAILFSLIQSAKRAGLDPFAYLRDLLRAVPTHPQSCIHELFPDQWKKSSAES